MSAHGTGPELPAGSSGVPRPTAGAACLRGLVLVAAAGALQWLLLSVEQAPEWLLSGGFVAALAATALLFRRLWPDGPERPPAAARPSPVLLGVLVVLPAVLSVAYVAALRLEGISGVDARVWSVVVFGLATPVVEEYYFRHLLHRELEVVFPNRALRVIAGAVWFGAMHLPHTVPVALAVGLCCTWLRVLTGSIRLPVAAHLLTNLALEVLG